MDVLQTLKSERNQLLKDLNRVDAAIKALGGWSSSGGRTAGGRPRISADGKARIAAAQRARWAKVKANQGQKQNVVSMPKFRQKTMSAAARKKIAASQRARWAKIKKSAKTA